MHLKNLVYLVHVDSTNSPPPPCGLTWTFHEPPLPPSGPHGLRMPPKKKIFTLHFGSPLPTIAIHQIKSSFFDFSSSWPCCCHFEIMVMILVRMDTMQSVIIPPYLKKEKRDREKNYHNAIINSQQNYISISAIKYQP